LLAHRPSARIPAMRCLLLCVSLAAAEPEVARFSDPLLRECSGLAASRAHPGVLWSHNDSGNASELFATDAQGAALARFPLAIRADDWEDIAIDARGIYIADIGDNRAKRATIRVHRVAEPDPAHPPSGPLPITMTWRLRYPDQPHDAEALVVSGDEGFIIDKRIGVAKAWRFRLDGAAEQILEHVASLAIPAPVTGADMSPDGKWLAVVHPFGVHVIPLAGGIATADVAKAVLLSAPMQLDREAVTFTTGGIFAATEKGELRWFPDTWTSDAGR
jgi:hypothetical protein